ncbi:MAG: hypothetical protein FGM24_09430 [Candidatus Kapabacteria bacterium]|nr:hypothetical protein [Candidatus Kapabacteria bacterium]
MLRNTALFVGACYSGIHPQRLNVACGSAVLQGGAAAWMPDAMLRTFIMAATTTGASLMRSARCEFVKHWPSGWPLPLFDC